MLVSIEAEHTCFALIPIGTGAIPIGIVSMSIGIGAFPIGIRAKSTGIGVFPIGIGAIPIGIRAKSIGTGPIPAGIVSIPIGIRAIPIDFGPVPIENAPVPIGIRAMQTRFPAAAAGFQPEQSGSAAHDAAFRLAAKTKAAREGGWLQFLQEQPKFSGLEYPRKLCPDYQTACIRQQPVCFLPQRLATFAKILFCSVLCGYSGRQGQKDCPRDKFSMNPIHETARQADSSGRARLILELKNHRINSKML